RVDSRDSIRLQCRDLLRAVVAGGGNARGLPALVSGWRIMYARRLFPRRTRWRPLRHVLKGAVLTGAQTGKLFIVLVAHDFLSLLDVAERDQHLVGEEQTEREGLLETVPARTDAGLLIQEGAESRVARVGDSLGDRAERHTVRLHTAERRL